MKKVILTLAFIAVLLGLFAVEVTIGTGVSTNGSTAYPAVYGNYYKNSREQYLVTAGELNTGGGGAGNITSIAFNVAALNGCGARPMVIKMGHYAGVTLTTTFVTGLTPVKTIATYTPVVGWNTHALDIAFNWNGTSSLVVEVFYGDRAQAYTNNTGVYYTTATNQALYYRSDTLDANAQLTGTMGTWRPNMKYEMQPYVAAPPGPAAIVSPLDGVSGVLPTATMNWAAGSGLPTGYKFQYGTNPAADNILPLTNLFGATTYDPADMTYGWTYYWKVVPYNGSGDCTTAPVWSFTVRNNPTVSPPWMTDFGTLAGHWPVLDWTQYSHQYGSAPVVGTLWYQDDWVNVLSPVNKSAKRNVWSTANYGWLVTPPVNVPVGDYEFKFDLGLTTYGTTNAVTPGGQPDDKFMVLWSPNANMSGATILGEWNNTGSPLVYDNIPNTGETIIFDLDALGISGVVYFGFYGESTVSNGDNDLFVDNVTVRETPAGPPDPVTLTYPLNDADNLPKAGFNLTWTPAVTGGTPEYYALYMSQDEGTIYSDVFVDNILGTSYNPVAMGDVTYDYEDRWFWTIEAVNGGGANSAVVEPPFWFDIEPDPSIALPHTQPFDGATIPGGWTQTYDGTLTSNRWTLSTTAMAGGTANEMLNTWASGDGNSRLITPPINTTGVGTLAVTFDHFFDDYGAGCTAKLQYSHNLTDWFDSSWSHASGAGNLTGNTTVLIPGLANPVTYVAWVINGNHFQYDYWYVDNAHFDEPLEHDVGVLSIDMPQVVSPVAFNPMATVTNLGINTETFFVEIEIGTWSDTQEVVGLASGATAPVTFALYTPTVNTGNDVDVTTLLGTDTNPANDTMASVLWCLDLSKQVYVDAAYDPGAILDGPATFTLATPGTITDLPQPPAHTNFMPGADWLPGVGTNWWGNDFGTTNFWNIDPVTGLMVDSGDIATAFNGIAYNSNANIWYGVSGTGAADDALYTFDGINPPTLVAPITWGGAAWDGLLIGLAYDNVINVLYGVDIMYNAFFTINTTTADMTELGYTVGYDLNYAQDIALDQDTGFLYHASYHTTGELLWIDTTTGIGYSIGAHMNGAELTGFAIPYGGAPLDAPVVSIADDGTLSWPPVAGATIYNVYSATDPFGTFTYEGNTAGIIWLDPSFPETKKFYVVTATDGTRQSRPVMQRNVTNSRAQLATPTRQAVKTPASAAPVPRTK